MHQHHRAGISQAASRARNVLLLAAIALLIATIGAASLSLGASSVAAQTPTPVSPVPIQPDRDGDLSGRYFGTQDDQRFGMALTQAGNLLHGVIVQPLPQTSDDAFLDAATDALIGDRLFGIVDGDNLYLIRFSNPAEFWFGAISRTSTAIVLEGRWVSSQGSGEWKAESVRHATLDIAARVIPNTIRAGETTRVDYGVRIDNTSDRSARSVELDLRDLPDFYRIDSITIVRGHLTDDLETLDAAPIAPTSVGPGLSLPLGDLAPNASVFVRIDGAASPDDAQAGEHTSVAVASARNARTETARVTLTVGAGPDLTVSGRPVPNIVPAGEDTRVTYNVLVANLGNGAAENVQLQVAGLPRFFRIDGIDIVRGPIRDNLEARDGAPQALAPADGFLSLPLGDIDPHFAALVRIRGVASPGPDSVGDHLTTATASAGNARPAATRMTLTVTGGPDLTIAARVAPAQISVGEVSRVSYGVTISNFGAQTAHGVQLELSGLPPFFLIDSIEIFRGPAGLDLESRPGDSLALGGRGGTLSLPLGDIDAHEAVFVRVGGVATPEHRGEFTSVASATSRDGRSVTDRVLLTVIGDRALDRAIDRPVDGVAVN